MNWLRSNLLRRTITAAIGAALLIGSAWLGGWYFGGVVLLTAILGQWEWYGLLRRAGLIPWRFTGLSIGILLALHPLLPGSVRLAMVPLVLLLVWMPFSKRGAVVHSFCATISGALYPAALLSFLLYLRAMNEGFLLVVTVFVLVWVADICAYVAGRLWGRHKLAPITSPNKTWEGYIAGIVGPLVVGAAIFYTFAVPLGLVPVLVLAMICGVASASGDLAESRFKRAVQLSDSGNLLPGHGGVLDRFDGMIVAAPLAYLFMWVIGAGG